MKRGKLYVKIYLFYILILFVTEILILCLFMFVVSGEDKGAFRQYINAQVYMGNRLLEEVAEDYPEIPIGEIQEIEQILGELGRLYRAKLWIQDADGAILTASFEGKPPDLRRVKKRGGEEYDLYARHRRTMPYMLTIPLSLQEKEASTLFIVFERPQAGRFQTTFLIGLLLIGAVTALLLLPLSRTITKPLERLRLSALKIADGDLKERAGDRGRDEIGDLVNSFNVMADRVERMVTGTKQLTANISHQLRSPLARIRVAWELLWKKMAGSKTEDVSRYMESIREEIGEIDHLIGQVLILSKLEMREQRETAEYINLAGFLRELEERYMTSIRQKRLVYKRGIPESGLAVLGEREQLKTAFSSIYDNAIKFTPAGGSIDLRAHREEEKVVVSMANSSGPPDDDALEHLFEPFYRSGGSTAPGTGLGLTIAKKAVENLGGTIEASWGNGEFVVRVIIRSTSEDER
jgi:signal transduction histidine kinase